MEKEEKERLAAEKAKKKPIRYPTEDLDVVIGDREKRAGMKLKRPVPSRVAMPFGHDSATNELFLMAWNFLNVYGYVSTPALTFDTLTEYVFVAYPYICRRSRRTSSRRLSGIQRWSRHAHCSPKFMQRSYTTCGPSRSNDIVQYSLCSTGKKPMGTTICTWVCPWTSSLPQWPILATTGSALLFGTLRGGTVGRSRS